MFALGGALLWFNADGDDSSPATGHGVETSVAGVSIELHRSAFCDCCEEYVRYLEAHRMAVREVIREDMQDLKESLGLPADLRSCHTAYLDGYFLEGHVPLEVIALLLEARPEVDGIALPGMPAGSPGMPGDRDGAWTIYEVLDGEPAQFAQF